MNIDVSIIIVNYNVQYFIEQCLNSIFSLSDFKGHLQVIVVDNNSSDGSVEMIKAKFPQVELIANAGNYGFSVGNNQGIKIAHGKYILLLNPDTILEEETLSKCFLKMESDKEIGILSVKMLDGGGKFLPESKRGFPTPATTFFKFTGLYRLFPRSKKINAYYLGHIDEDKTSIVDILCGAFMFIRKSDLDQIGLLDEDFFMFGEDIDLSYRFQQAQKKVVYFPETTIIHFKGESTKKHSMQYIYNFNNAMNIFAVKHFKNTKAKRFIGSLSLVIKTKAILHYLSNFLNAAALPIFDILSIFLGLKIIAFSWAKFYFGNEFYYDSAPLFQNFILYSMVWMLGLLYAGAYDSKFKNLKLIRNILFGTLIILAIYGLLGEGYRSSRAIIIIANFYVILSSIGIRMLIYFIKNKKFINSGQKGKNVFLIANFEEAKRIKSVMLQSNMTFSKITILPIEISAFELSELIKLNKADEVICNMKDLGMKKVIGLMAALGDKVSFKITGDESLGIIGSKSKNTSGEIYTISINYEIQEQSKKRMKRTFDIAGSLVLMVLFPILIFSKKYIHILKNLPEVILNKKSIIGYNVSEDKNTDLPQLKKGIIFPISKSLKQSDIHQSNLEYAKYYSVWDDARILVKFLQSK